MYNCNGPSWKLDLQLHDAQSVPIATKDVSSNLVHGEVHSIHYVIKVCQFMVFSAVSSINKTDHHDITTILLKVALNTITHHPVLYISRYV